MFLSPFLRKKAVKNEVGYLFVIELRVWAFSVLYSLKARIYHYPE
jgi:hypothetical protein